MTLPERQPGDTNVEICMQTKLENIDVPCSTRFTLTIPAQHVRPDGDWCNECTTRMASSLFACSTPATENDNINNIIIRKSMERLAIHISWWYQELQRVPISTGEANTAKPIPDNMAVKREWLTTISGCLMFKHPPKRNDSVRGWSGEWLWIYGTLHESVTHRYIESSAANLPHLPRVCTHTIQIRRETKRKKKWHTVT